jgi:predicted AAA+ superfamily ATPase
MAETTPVAPADLAARGQAFWRETVKTYELSGTELELLRETARLLDECERLREAIDADGLTVAGSAVTR